MSCHGADLSGQPQCWTEADFFTLMHTGQTPRGRQIDSQVMPWQSFGKLDDDKLRALWMYQESLPPQETVTR